MPAVVGGLSSRSSGVSVHPTEVEGVLLRVWSSAVASSLQMSAPQKALDQPSQEKLFQILWPLLFGSDTP